MCQCSSSVAARYIQGSWLLTSCSFIYQSLILTAPIWDVVYSTLWLLKLILLNLLFYKLMSSDVMCQCSSSVAARYIQGSWLLTSCSFFYQSLILTAPICDVMYSTLWLLKLILLNLLFYKLMSSDVMCQCSSSVAARYIQGSWLLTSCSFFYQSLILTAPIKDVMYSTLWLLKLLLLFQKLMKVTSFTCVV